MESIEKPTREIVTPGMVISSDPELIPGRGAIRDNNNEIISLFVGLKEIRGKYINVVPLNGLYNPQLGDKIIGRVIAKTPVKYLLDINSKYLGILKPLDAFKRNTRNRGYGKSVGSYRVKDDDLMQKLKMGDLLICKVLSGNRLNEPELTSLGQDLGEIKEGLIINVPPPKIPRIIGKKGSMISLLKNLLHCKIFVAQNGRILIQGGKKFKNELLLIDAIHKIEKEAHTTGLTDRIRNYIIKEKKKRGIE
ncbi:MAG: exosome complex RNA-binding protein Rrp4 [Promethearchaeota archaeon]